MFGFAAQALVMFFIFIDAGVGRQAPWFLCFLHGAFVSMHGDKSPTQEDQKL
jgi:hypothetical protein